ncbi:MAG: hypothetical protein GY746_09550 [Gammaproteobacteria bacterium]|nr:hypothetical protein [Gammaproteobacteria bacterium]
MAQQKPAKHKPRQTANLKLSTQTTHTRPYQKFKPQKTPHMAGLFVIPDAVT